MLERGWKRNGVVVVNGVDVVVVGGLDVLMKIVSWSWGLLGSVLCALDA
jgi:hypothetical protein